MSIKKALLVLGVAAAIIISTNVTQAQASGDVNLFRVGDDQQTSSAPANTSSAVDTTTLTATNNVNYNSKTVGTHTAYTSYMAGRTILFGTCNYTRAAPQCTVTNFSTPTNCDANLGYCTNTFEVYENQVTKVAWQYSSASQSASIIVKRVGAAETTASAPTGNAGKVDSAALNTQNPATFSGLSTSGSHIVYVSNLVGYNVELGYCFYDSTNASDCTDISFSNYGVTCDNNIALCYRDVGGVGVNQVMKTVWKYTVADPSNPTIGATTGDIRIKVVGSDLLTSSAPNGIFVRPDAYQNSSANPALFANVILGNHDAYATYLAGYSPVAGMCTYPRGGVECTVTSFSGTTCDANVGYCKLASIYVQEDTVTKVVFKYDEAGSGDVRVKRVGPDLLASSAPAAQVKVDSQNYTSTNPVTFTNISTQGGHTAYATFAVDKNVSVGTCTYNRGESECGVSSFSEIFSSSNTNTQQYCDRNSLVCYWPVTVNNADVTKVVFKYDTGTATGPDVSNSPTTTSDIIITRTGSDGDSTATAPVGTTANVSGYTASTTNPAYYRAITAGNGESRTVYFTNTAGLTESYAYCDYQRGATPCVPSNWTDATSCDSSLCSFTLNLGSQNRIYKVVTRYYSASTADFMIMRIGSDEATTSAPVGTVAGLDTTSSNTTTVNPGMFYGVTAGGSHTAYSSNVSGQVIKVAYCDYARGGLQCAPTNYQDPSCVGSWCSISVGSWSSDRIYKVIFRYVSPSTSDIFVQREGEDQELAVISTSVRVNGVTKTENPAWYNSLSTGTYYDVYTTFVPLSQAQIAVSSCSYARGGRPCVPSFGLYADGSYGLTSRIYGGNGEVMDTISPDNPANEPKYGCNTTTNLCRFRVDIGSQFTDQVFKVVFKYIPTTNQVTGSNTGDIKVKRVGQDLYAASAPSATVSFDGGATTSVNPVLRTFNISDLGPNTHTIAVTQPTGTTILPGHCGYARGTAECAVTNFGLQFTWFQGYYTGNLWTCDPGAPVCTATVTPQKDSVLKVAFKYETPEAGQVKVKIVGSDLTTASAPIPVIPAYIDSQPPITSNIGLYTAVPQGDHIAYAPAKVDYEVSVGACVYPQGGTECIIGSTFGSAFRPASCTSTLCSYGSGTQDVNVANNQVTKVVWRYEKINAQPYTLSNAGNMTVNAGQGGENMIKAKRQFGNNLPITFSSSNLVSNGISVSTPAGCTTDCDTPLTFSTSESTPAGVYPITVTGTPFGVTTSFNLTVNAAPEQPPTVGSSCGASPSAVVVGSKVTWTAAASGAGNYTYQWQGTTPYSPGGATIIDIVNDTVNTPPVVVISNGGKTAEVVYATPGLKTMRVLIGGDGSGVCSRTINVGPKPNFVEF